MSNEETDILPAAWNEIIKIRKHEEADWWTYALRAMKETDPEKREAIYEEGLEKCPDSHELMTNYAIFLAALKKITRRRRSII